MRLLVENGQVSAARRALGYLPAESKHDAALFNQAMTAPKKLLARPPKSLEHRATREMVALDPQCVLCRDLLARSLDSVARELGAATGGPLRAEARQVRAEIARVAPDSWIGRLIRADVLWRGGDRAGAIDLARRVVDSGPPTKERVWDYAFMIYAMGHLEEATALVERVRAFEPMALYLSRDLQYDYTAARRFDDAEAEYRRARVLDGSQLWPDYLAFFRQNLLRYRGWMQRPDTSSPTSRSVGSELAPRGAAWMFLRYATDFHSNGNMKSYLRRVVGGPDIGLRNLLQHSNGAQFDDLLSGWLISQFTDGLNIPNLPARYRMNSWAVRDVMAGSNSNVFPLLVTPLPNNISTKSISGSGNYFRLTRVGPSPETTFRMQATSGSAVSFQGARVYVVRIS